MDIQWWHIWLISVADQFHIGALVICIASLFLGGMLLAMSFDFSGIQRKYPKLLIAVGIIFGFLSIFTPNMKSAGAMLVIPAIVNNENIRGITSNSLELLNSLTRKWLDELNDEVKSSDTSSSQGHNI